MNTSTAPLPRRPWKPTLALGTAALAASTAHGAIVYNNFTDLVLTDPNPTSYNGLQITGNVQFYTGTSTIFASLGSSGSFAINFQAVDQVLKKGKVFYAEQNARSAVAIRAGGPLTFGTLINSGSTNNVSMTGATFTNLTNAYAGVRIPNGADFNYGWVRYSTGPGFGVYGPSTITIHDAAFETTVNTSILAGSTASVVPEPSRALLLGLAGGALALRRRRSAKQAA